MNTRKKQQTGFTIIEVVLVLAIAALIFLMVFIALPALQRNQRDTARKTVTSKVSSAVTSYQSNNRGAQPTNGAALNGYVDGTVSGNDTQIESEYTVKVNKWASGDTVGAAAKDVVQVYTGATCGTGDDINKAVSGTTRNAAILIQLENGSAVVCQSV